MHGQISPGTAALALARRHGLEAGSARVLHDGSNVLIALDPLPLVARVAGTTAQVRMRPAEALSRDVEVAGWLARDGARVVPPTDLLPAGPLEQSGYGMTFWRLVEHTGTVTDPGQAAQSLFDLHRRLARYEGALPGPQPMVSDALRGVALARDAGLIDVAAAEQLSTAGMRFARDLARGTFALHGDAHPGNLLVTAGGPVWTDFEDTWRGPLEWDLAALRSTSRLDGAIALARYRELAEGTFRIDPAVLDLCVQARAWHMACWWLIHTLVVPEHFEQAAAAFVHWQALATR